LALPHGHDGHQLCLLDIDPADQGLQQRRVIEVEIGGEKVWRELDIVRVFDDVRGVGDTHL
jgi:hypothetical protein